MNNDSHGIFQDSEGNGSSKRISSFICIITAVIIGIGAWIMKAENTSLIIGLVVSFLGAGLALQGISWGQEIALKSVNKE